MSARKLILVPLVGLLLAGCAMTYHQDGVEKLAPAETAVIETDSLIECMPTCVTVLYVDGKHRGLGEFVRYELVPGYREIGVMYFEPQFGRLVEGREVLHLGFTAEPGHIYRVRANANVQLMGWHPEIFDKESGLVVSKIVRTSEPP